MFLGRLDFEFSGSDFQISRRISVLDKFQFANQGQGSFFIVVWGIGLVVSVHQIVGLVSPRLFTKAKV